jgi:2,5-diamino-6-(ribosylamino)-4(3H)-pyrimidinone 5'-phosphate reductase
MRPKVILHNAVSLDSRNTGFPADIGLYYELISRWQEDAILAGSGTMLAAPEEVPAESELGSLPSEQITDDSQPLLVVPDSRGRIKAWHHWRHQPYWRDVLVLCSHSTPAEYLEYLERQQVSYLVAGQDHVDFRQALDTLYQGYNIRVLRVDSGGTLNGLLLRAGLVDELSLLVHPCLVGENSTSFFIDPGSGFQEGVISLHLQHLEALRDGLIWIIYELVNASPGEEPSSGS